MKTRVIKILSLLLTLLPIATQAEFSNESEVSIVVNGGNSKLEVYTAKTKNTYKANIYQFKFFGHYTYGTSSDEITGRNWSAGIRLERELNEKISAFLGEEVEGDKFSGIDIRYNTDLGLKYTFFKDKNSTLLSEVGYRYSSEKDTTGEKSNVSKGRLYLEGSRQASEDLFYRLWIEYIPNFNESDDYLFNFEPSLNFVLAKYLSLKIAYKGMYDNVPVAGNKKIDYLYTTSLIARF